MSQPDSTEALTHLRDMIAGFDGGARQRGRAYYNDQAVIELFLDDDIVTASVQGSEVYTTTLLWADDEWSCECSCPMEFNCKHTYAVALAWIDRCAGKSLRPKHAVEAVASAAPTSGPGRKLTFREEWSTVLAKKTGRALTEEEGRLLGQLAALHAELRTGTGIVTLYALQHRGLSPTNQPPGGNFAQPAFDGWWPRNEPPADPWALWQYIAYAWERNGRPIPEAFRPMTDTSTVRAAVEPRMLERDLERWRQALHAHAISTEASAVNSRPLGEEPDLRLAFDTEGIAALEVRLRSDKPWKQPTKKWLEALSSAGLEEISRLPENARGLALALRLGGPYGGLRYYGAVLPGEILASVIAHPPARAAMVLPDGSPFSIEEQPLQILARPDTASPGQLILTLVKPDLTPVSREITPFCDDPVPLYLIDNHIWRGPPALPAERLPTAALSDPGLSLGLRTIGLRVPEEFEAKFKHVALRPLMRCWLDEGSPVGYPANFHALLFAQSAEPPCLQHWSGESGWQWAKDGQPPLQKKDEPVHHYDLAAANAVGARFGAFQLHWSTWSNSWTRTITKTFPEDFAAWRASLPPGVQLEVSPELKGLVAPPLRARLTVTLTPAKDSGQDWFDLAVMFQPDDLTLTPEEIQLLLKARGGWVQLPGRGWQRLALEDTSDDATRAELDHLGLAADAELLVGKRAIHRFHALQLADSAVAAQDEAMAGRLRTRVAELRALPPPPLPAGLQAVLRPYQEEGYHFLAHLASLGLGGVLADDMGLGKTLQTLTWLLWLQARVAGEGRTLRALVVCPKSVVPNWLTETARFTPALSTTRLAPGTSHAPGASILVVNYTQLRLHSAELNAIAWDAVILDEGQNIKNPGSATAHAARELRARHRIVLTGTPIENRLLDLWSLFAFAQPGLLGSQAGFQRHYGEKDDPAGARSRLATRVRPFLLRRTKGQVARDLPSRMEEEILCELEGPQRTLYDAELKHTRQMLLRVKSARQFDSERFNILQSLLRLRQICCDPRLVGLESAVAETPASRQRRRPVPPAGEPVPSAKLDALMETLEPLVEEGHRVLVFSQFVSMLELIRAELVTRKIDHLMLTGQTENRQELVEQFQGPDGPPVFLLSLKAAGTGLNLTAASYVMLYDPWWNPAVEAQAIDRTHRIGQTSQVIAYRLLAKDTIEEKIRALQREKASMAAAVVKEESLATVLDLESLRRILS